MGSGTFSFDSNEGRGLKNWEKDPPKFYWIWGRKNRSLPHPRVQGKLVMVFLLAARLRKRTVRKRIWKKGKTSNSPPEPLPATSNVQFQAVCGPDVSQQTLWIFLPLMYHLTSSTLVKLQYPTISCSKEFPNSPDAWRNAFYTLTAALLDARLLLRQEWKQNC